MGRAIDFAWCHLAIQSFQLSDILPKIHRQDLSVVAEMILPMIDKINSKDVDWLAWEDPLILSRNPETLKFERENSIVETKKRLGYVIPMVQMISEAAIVN